MAKTLKIEMLPPVLTLEEQIELLKLNNKLTEKLRVLDVKMSNRKVNYQIINSMRMREALESTKIEGTQTTITKVFEAEVENKGISMDTQEVVNYLNSLSIGKIAVENDHIIVGRTLKMIHKNLLKGHVRGKNRLPGEYRNIDNWIGAEGAAREKASYNPPSHIEIGDYMSDLEKHINAPSQEFEELPTVVRAAIIHAQFESIHPFLDGNGRVGRMLIPLYFKLKNDETLSNIFISGELEGSKFKYYDLLNGTRKQDPEWYPWIKYFLNSTISATDKTIVKYDSYLDLYKRSSDSDDLAFMKVLDMIFEHPIVTINMIKHGTNLGDSAARRVVDKMIARKILYKGDGQRNVKHYFYDLISIVG